MVLDALIKIKNEIDPTLTFRRSCREGVCGSCAMNIQGGNTLACTKAINDCSGAVAIYPLAAHAGGEGSGARPHQFLRPIFLDPALSADQDRRSRKRNGSSRRKTAPSWTGFMSASSAPAARPHAPAIGGIRERYLGPAALLQSYRWLVDSRDEETGERLDNLEDPFRLYRCHTIMNCAQTCPKGLNPAQAIGEIKQMMVKRKTLTALTCQAAAAAFLLHHRAREIASPQSASRPCGSAPTALATICTSFWIWLAAIDGHAGPGRQARIELAVIGLGQLPAPGGTLAQ